MKPWFGSHLLHLLTSAVSFMLRNHGLIQKLQADKSRLITFTQVQCGDCYLVKMRNACKDTPISAILDLRLTLKLPNVCF